MSKPPDERGDKISGSKMAAYAACAGRFQLEQKCPQQPSGPAAQLGQRVHAYLAGLAIGKVPRLAEDEQEIADACASEHNQLIHTIAKRTGVEKCIVEERIWFEDMWSGAIDRIDFITDTEALVTDYKTGRIAQSNASENLQLRAYAVLVKHRYPELKKIYAAIIQPYAGPSTVVEYDEADLESAKVEILAIVEKAYAPDAKRTPSPDACKYCAAKTICPEANGTTKELMTAAKQDMMKLDPEALADYLDRAEIVEDLIEALRIEAKRRLMANMPVRGYTLAKGITTRSITDTDAAYNKVRDIVPPHVFADCCKVSIPKLEKAYAVSRGLKDKDAKTELATMLGDLITAKQGDPKMIRK